MPPGEGGRTEGNEGKRITETGGERAGELLAGPGGGWTEGLVGLPAGLAAELVAQDPVTLLAGDSSAPPPPPAASKASGAQEAQLQHGREVIEVRGGPPSSFQPAHTARARGPCGGTSGD